MFIIIYGLDGTGKSVQAKNIAEANEQSESWSFATKNRKLYEMSGVHSTELLAFTDDFNVNPYKTIDNFHDAITKLIKENKTRLLIIDEITLLRTWAQFVVLEEVRRAKKAKGETPPTKLGKDNLMAWARVNEIVYGELVRLSNWAVNNDAVVITITAMTEERRLVTNSEGETSRESTGRYIIDAKLNVKKLADAIIRLEKNGSNGKGYYAIFDKMQDWMSDGENAVKIDKNGLLTEFVIRGVIE